MQHCSGSLYGADSVHCGHCLHRTDITSVGCLFMRKGTIEFATVCLSVRPSVHFVIGIFMPTHQTYEHGTSNFLYHAPGVAPFVENTIILSRWGTLELRVHWSPLTLERQAYLNFCKNHGRLWINLEIKAESQMVTLCNDQIRERWH